ncbi:hypothetical protein BJ878DRAFT_543111 [Calycina marina]|uniref:DUF6594 domain-containing protein n=1 Tax=Calycina marina TaxID=1763456 RepID=A0A9P8CFQ9_9HELO|nr:hypothetical protein BJ878DRAFT_543111 [Calycina marina]
MSRILSYDSQIEVVPVKNTPGNPHLERRADAKSRLVLLDKGNVAFSNHMVRTAVMTVTIIAVFVVSIYVLWALSSRANSDKAIGMVIAVTLLFILVFSVIMSAFTRATRHEILAATAAYCAVLVVFIGYIRQLDAQKTNNTR